MKSSKFAIIEEKIDSFPSLPATVAEVMKVIEDDESSADDLTEVILQDQSMCTAILKMANSVLYGRPKKVSSLESAIMVLGFDEILNIVLSKSVVSSFKDIFKKDKKIITAFWDHSFTTALTAKAIADNLNLSSPGQFFIGGLIHDIGKLALLLSFPDEYETEKWLVGFSTAESLEVERSIFSLTHAEIGSKLLEKWHFPNHLLTALEYHHNPENAPMYSGFPTLIQMADALAFLCNHPERIDDQHLVSSVKKLIPDIEEQWFKQNLPWQEVRLAKWFNSVMIYREHGNSVLAILSG